MKKRTRSRVRGILLGGGVLFFLVAAILASTYLFFGRNSISGNNITLQAGTAAGAYTTGQDITVTTLNAGANGNATIRSYYASFTPGDAAFNSAARIDSASTNDPAASSQNNLKRQFWGDYNTLVSTNGAAYFIYTDARHGTGCPVVDSYQHDLTSPKPTPCSGPTFGDTDIFVSKVTP